MLSAEPTVMISRSTVVGAQIVFFELRNSKALRRYRFSQETKRRDLSKSTNTRGCPSKADRTTPIQNSMTDFPYLDATTGENDAPWLKSTVSAQQTCCYWIGSSARARIRCPRHVSCSSHRVENNDKEHFELRMNPQKCGPCTQLRTIGVERKITLGAKGRQSATQQSASFIR
jgi:hypothetical protein